jgi:hypothetical protein
MLHLQASRISIDSISNSSTSQTGQSRGCSGRRPDTGPATAGSSGAAQFVAQPQPRNTATEQHSSRRGLQWAAYREQQRSQSSLRLRSPQYPLLFGALSSESVPVQLEGEYLGARGRVRYTVARCQHISSGACRAALQAKPAAGLPASAAQNDYLDSLGALDLRIHIGRIRTDIDKCVLQLLHVAYGYM